MKRTTRLGRFFDLALIFCIVASVVVVMMDSIGDLRSKYGAVLHFFEWFFTILFTIEYVVRLLCVGHPWKYMRSFFGVIDLLGFLPTYIATESRPRHPKQELPYPPLARASE